MKKLFSILLVLACMVSLSGFENVLFWGVKSGNDLLAAPSVWVFQAESNKDRTLPSESNPLSTAGIDSGAEPSESGTLPSENPLLFSDIESSLKDRDFAAVNEYIPEIAVELKYAAKDNFTGQVIYEFNDAYLRYGTVKKLIDVSKQLAEQGLYLKIWDAFRPPAAQVKLWEAYPDPNYVSNPHVKYSSHSRGNTVDVTLVDAQGKELEMPTGFDDFSALADRDYTDCSPIAAANALLLQKTMEKNGFTGYFKEWWHYSDETEYPMEECFDPSAISMWYADCNEYITLRSAPDFSAASVAKIPAGEQFTLLGCVNEFAMAEYSGQRGYVVKNYIQPVGASAAATTAWTPNCEEFISLRSTPGGSEVITKILLGETFTIEKWQGRYALVSYKGLKGYVLSTYIKPASNNFFHDNLKVVDPTYCYSYEQMKDDIAKLQNLYPNTVRSFLIGTSELGRDIPVIQIGNENAQKHVLIQAAMHGREHLTAWLAMAIADFSLSKNYFDADTVCYHIIPMTNPDGVMISQSGELGDSQLSIYNQDMNAGHTSSVSSVYANGWKANALGVDLNRNFPSGWEASTGREEPSSEQYRGTAPFCTVETAALRDYTLKYPFAATISLHSSGSEIYYKYGDKKSVIDRSRTFAQAIGKITGYPIEECDGTDGAGYKDWCIDELCIPSVTIEIGSMNTPLPERELYNVFDRCREMIPAITEWLIGQ